MAAWRTSFFFKTVFDVFQNGSEGAQKMAIESLKESGQTELLMSYVIAKGSVHFLPRDVAVTIFDVFEKILTSMVELPFGSIIQMANYMARLCLALSSSDYIGRLDDIYSCIFSPIMIGEDAQTVLETCEERGESCLVVAHIARQSKGMGKRAFEIMTHMKKRGEFWGHAWLVLFEGGFEGNEVFECIPLIIEMAKDCAVADRAELMTAIIGCLPADEGIILGKEHLQSMVLGLSNELRVNEVLKVLKMAIMVLKLRKIVKCDDFSEDDIIEMIFRNVLPFVSSYGEFYDLVFVKLCDLLRQEQVNESRFAFLSMYSKKCVAVKFPSPYSIPFVFVGPVDQRLLVYFVANVEFSFMYVIPCLEHLHVEYFNMLFRLKDRKPNSFWNRVVIFLSRTTDFSKLKYIADVIAEDRMIPWTVVNEVNAAFLNVGCQIVSSPSRFKVIMPIMAYLRDCKENIVFRRINGSPRTRKIAELFAEESGSDVFMGDSDSGHSDALHHHRVRRRKRLENHRRGEIVDGRSEDARLDRFDLNERLSTNELRNCAVDNCTRTETPSDHAYKNDDNLDVGRRKRWIRRRRRGTTESEVFEESEVPRCTRRDVNQHTDGIVTTLVKHVESVDGWSAELMSIIAVQPEKQRDRTMTFVPVISNEEWVLTNSVPTLQEYRALFFGNMLSRSYQGIKMLEAIVASDECSKPSINMALNAMASAQNAYRESNLYSRIFMLALVEESLRSLCCHAIVITCGLLPDKSIRFDACILKLVDMEACLHRSEFEAALKALLLVTNKITGIPKIINAVLGKTEAEQALLSGFETSREQFFQIVEDRARAGYMMTDCIMRTYQYDHEYRCRATVLLRAPEDMFPEIVHGIYCMKPDAAATVLESMIERLELTEQREQQRFLICVPKLLVRIRITARILNKYAEKFSLVMGRKIVAYVRAVLPVARHEFVRFWKEIHEVEQCSFIESLFTHICQNGAGRESWIACLEDDFRSERKDLKLTLLFCEKFIQFQITEDGDPREIATLLAFLVLAISKKVNPKTYIVDCMKQLSDKIGVPIGSRDRVVSLRYSRFVAHFDLLDDKVCAMFVDALLRLRVPSRMEIFARLFIVLGEASIVGRTVRDIYVRKCRKMVDCNQKFIAHINISELEPTMIERFIILVADSGSLSVLRRIVESMDPRVLEHHDYLKRIIARCYNDIFCDDSVAIMMKLTAIETVRLYFQIDEHMFELLVPVVIERQDAIVIVSDILGTSVDIFENLFTFTITYFHSLEPYFAIAGGCLRRVSIIDSPTYEHISLLCEIMQPCLYLNDGCSVLLGTRLLALLNEIERSAAPELVIFCSNVCVNLSNQCSLLMQTNSEEYDWEHIRNIL